MSPPTSDGGLQVTFVVNSLNAGGAEIHTLRLAEALSRLGWQVTIMPLAASERPVERQGDIRIEYTGHSFLYRMRSVLGVRQHIRKSTPRLVVAVNQRPLLVAWIALRGISRRTRLAFIFHSSPDLIAGTKAKLLYRMTRYISARVARNIFVSRIQCAACELDGFSGNHSIIRNGVDNQRFNTSVAERLRATTRSELGLQDDDFVVTVCAAFRPEKNHLQIIQVADELLRGGCRVKLILVGDGPERPHIEREIDRLSITQDVRLIGYQPDVRPYVSAADVSVLASKSETMSLAILESMALGVPPVVTRVGGATEVITEGVNGLTYDPSRPSELLEALRNLHDRSILRRLGIAAAATAHAELGFAAMCRAYDQEFRNIVREAWSEQVGGACNDEVTGGRLNGGT